MSWTDARVETLKTYWAAGYSCGDIARRLGGVTRNAVIGKISRLGLSGRKRPLRRGSAPMRGKKPEPVRPLTAPKRSVLTNLFAQGGPASPLPEALPTDVARLTILTVNAAGKIDVNPALTRESCRWPVGDPRDKDFGYCGHARHANLAYCEDHARRAYAPPRSQWVQVSPAWFYANRTPEDLPEATVKAA